MLPRALLPLLIASLTACAPSADKADTSPSGLDTTDTAAVCADGGSPDRLWYRDMDGDGYGETTYTVAGCVSPAPEFIAIPGDCDDTNASVNPGAVEVCDGLDNDCNGVVDDGTDVDGDGHQDAAQCPDGDDCDDSDPTIYAGAPETCSDGIDSNCDGEDARCHYNTDVSAADALLYAAVSDGDAGRHLDAGDLDGDGAPDLVVGAMFANSDQGEAWVVPGPVGGTAALADVAVLIAGGTDTFYGGRSVAVGDTTDDGFADILLGAPYGTGANAVVVFGPVDGDMSFDDADVLAGCDSNVGCGEGGDIGDINGDGIGDALIGAPLAGTGGAYSGSVYALFGPLSAAAVQLPRDADAELIGAAPSVETGSVVAAGGDLDGDGVGDLLIIAAHDAEGGDSAGAVLVVLGPVRDDLGLADTDGLLLGGLEDEVGDALTMSDLDGDGRDDALVGAHHAHPGVGRVYGILGAPTGTTDLRDAELTIQGDWDEQGLGISLAAQDIDGDGAAELLVGDGVNPEEGRVHGAAYVFLGPLEGALDSTDAFATFRGVGDSDDLGGGTALADLNGDGDADLVIGVPGDGTEAVAAGAIYGIYSAL